MKKVLILILLCNCTLLDAQNSIRTFQTEMSATEVDLLIGYDGKSCFALKKLSDELTIFHFDSAFHLIARNTFGKLTLKDGIYQVYDCKLLDGKPVLFYFRQAKKIRTLVAVEINVETMQLKGTYETLAQYTAPPTVYSENDRSEHYIDYEFNIVVSGNGRCFSVSYVMDLKTFFSLFSGSLVKSWEVTYDMYFLPFYRDLRVTDDGRIFLLHKSNVAWPENWMLVEMNNGKLSGTPLDNGNYDFFCGAIGFTPSGNVFVAGYYSFYADKYEIIRNTGIFYFAPWKDNGEVSFVPFSKKVLAENRSDFERKQIEKEYSKHGCSGADGLYYVDVLTDSLGNIFVIGEEVYDKSLHLAANFYTYTANSIFMVRLEANERLVYASLLVSVLDTTGKVNQNIWIGKKQNNTGFASYCASVSSGSINILFNDNFRNIGHESDTSAGLTAMNSVDRSVVTGRTVTANGEVKCYMPFGPTEPFVLDVRGTLAGYNRLSLLLTNKRKLFFGTT